MNSSEIASYPDGPVDLLQLLEPEAYARVQEHVVSGTLPSDTFLRLDSIGDHVRDETDPSQPLLRHVMLLQLDRFAEAPEHLPPRTRHHFYSEPPRAFLSWRSGDRDTLHTAYDVPYLVRDDLADVIEERRIQQGKTVTEVPEDRRWRPAEDVERSQCLRIAHGLWRVMARRIMPEWLEPEALAAFYRPHKRGPSNNIHLDLGDSRHDMDRRIVHAVALEITHIKDIYDETGAEGVKGIGPVGREDLRTLLAEEYPDLH